VSFIALKYLNEDFPSIDREDNRRFCKTKSLLPRGEQMENLTQQEMDEINSFLDDNYDMLVGLSS
jgi:hypothetical protein